MRSAEALNDTVNNPQYPAFGALNLEDISRVYSEEGLHSAIPNLQLS
jgi:hypothetical protein